MIDNVFGFFEQRINTHFDIDQQLSRVRNPKRINVWISPEEFRFETDEEAIKAELATADSEYQHFLGFGPDRKARYEEDALYGAVYASITAAQRASKNRLKKNFVDLRRANGWKVEIVGHDKEMAKAGRTVADGAKEEHRRKYFEKLLAASQITQKRYSQFKELERAEKLSDRDKLAMERFAIEQFYRQDIDLGLLDKDNEGGLRRQILNYEILMESDESLLKWDRRDQDSFTPDRADYSAMKRALVLLFESAGLWAGGRFCGDGTISSQGLSEFSKQCISHKTELERRFSVAIRRDIRKNPVQQLNDFLKLVGQCAIRIGRSQREGKSEVFYKLDGSQLDEVHAWMVRRRDDAIRSAWMESRQDEDEIVQFIKSHPRGR